MQARLKAKGKSPYGLGGGEPTLIRKLEPRSMTKTTHRSQSRKKKVPKSRNYRLNQLISARTATTMLQRKEECWGKGR